MPLIEIEQVIATHRHEWKKWPDTDDQDYSSVFAERSTWFFKQDDVELRVHNKFYPVYSAYIRSGDLRIPLRFPSINNLFPPSNEVLEQQRKDLRELSTDAILWEHAHQCFPSVVSELSSLFKLRTLMHADDCPGSSEVKTFPVAPYFNALNYAMYVWNAEDGTLTADEYKKRGLAYPRFSPSSMSSGLAVGLSEFGFSIEQKQALIRSGRALPHLAFVGFTGNGERAQMFQSLIEEHAKQNERGLQMKIYGVGMPDGPIEPRDPPHPKGLGYPMAPLYATALASLNMPISSIFNCRLPDLFMSGVIQFVRDRWGELAKMGFVDGEHYIAFNGTANDLLTKLEELKSKPDYAADMIGHAYIKAKEFWTENSWTESYKDIYFKYISGAIP